MSLSNHERRVAFAMQSRAGVLAPGVASPRLTDLLKWRGAIVILSVTAAGTLGLTVNIRGYDAFGNPYKILTGAPTAATLGQFVFVIYPGSALPATTDVVAVASVPVPQEIDVQIIGADTTSYTYGVTVELLP